MAVRIDPRELAAGSVAARRSDEGLEVQTRAVSIVGLAHDDGGRSGLPSPIEFVLAGLASSATQLLPMVPGLSDVPLGAFYVAVSKKAAVTQGKVIAVVREVVVSSKLSEEQQSELKVTLSRCPVEALLGDRVEVETVVHEVDEHTHH